jgi:ABC-2 type transport system permease protein
MAIAWAQWRSIRNMLPRSGFGFYLTAAMTVMWYAMWVALAVVAAFLLAQATPPGDVLKLLGPGLLLAFLYWQLIPVLMVSSGASLNLRRLRVYPIPHGQLFALEVLLRITTGAEMIAMAAGAWVGLWANPGLRFWAPFPLLPFALLNLFLAAGIRELLTRWFAGRRFREAALALLFFLGALPQILLNSEWARKPARRLFEAASTLPFPWTVTARLASAQPVFFDGPGALAWTLATYLFARWQFERGLRFDEEAAGASKASAPGEAASRERFIDKLFRVPASVFSDPVAAMVEKDLRSLARSPRFRVLFLMGFTFGLLIWVPMMLGRSRSSFMSGNYLNFLCVYALMLLSEIPVWNFFGYDRAATQVYYLAPVPFTAVLRAKNAVAACFVVLEMIFITFVCRLLQLPMSIGRIAEAYAVTLILLGYLTAMGNLSSVYYPRKANARQSWGGSTAGRFQAVLLLIYPVVAIPFGVAYGARYLLHSEAAFVAGLLVAAGGAAAAYAISLRLAAEGAWQRREEILAVLGEGDAPVSA